MAKTKEKKKKGKAGKTVAGAGILALIAALLGFDPFGWGIGLGAGNGTGTGDGETRQEQQNKDYEMQDNQLPTVVPPATATPEATVTPVEQQENVVVQLVEVAVGVKKDKVVYNGTEDTAQAVVDALASEYADNKENILVKVTLTDAVYDTVEALKSALENKGIKYEVLE